MGQKRCKLSEKEYALKMMKPADFYCKKCNRQARNPKRLCKPKPLIADY